MESRFFSPLRGPRLLLPKLHADERGSFHEAFREDWFREAGIPPFVQENVSLSRKGVLRGLHLQYRRPQGKLIRVLEGRIQDVFVDVRSGSNTFGQWKAAELAAETGQQLWLPAGFAHGFLVLSERAAVEYKCTDYWDPKGEATLAWNDPELGIDWELEGEPVLSKKDADGLLLPQLRDLLDRTSAE